MTNTHPFLHNPQCLATCSGWAPHHMCSLPHIVKSISERPVL